MRLDGTPLRPEYVAAHEAYKEALGRVFDYLGFPPEVLRTIGEKGNIAFLNTEADSEKAALQLPPHLRELVTKIVPGIPLYLARIQLSHARAFFKMATKSPNASTPNGLLISEKNFAVDPWVIFDFSEGDYSFFEFPRDPSLGSINTDRTSLPITSVLMGDFVQLPELINQSPTKYASSHHIEIIDYPIFP